MATRAALVPAYVLHRRAFGETSLIAELFTRETGRLGVIAKGVRAKGRGGALQPFQPLLVAWRGRGDLPVLTAWEPASPPIGLQGDVLLGGFYVNELLIRLCPRHDAHPDVFLAYARTLGELDVGRCLTSVLRSFERVLLGSLGLEPPLARDCEGAPIRAEQWYRCAPRGAPRPVSGPGRTPWEVPGAALLALATEPMVIPRECQAAVNGLYRSLIAEQLGGVPLRTRALWRALHHPSPTPVQPSQSSEV